MSSFFRIVAIILFIFISSKAFAQKRQYGRYLNPRRYWTDEFILNKDSTFLYKCKHRTNDIEYYDSSSGKFKTIRDTIFLYYETNNYYLFRSDSPKDSLRSGIKEPHGYFGNRPEKLYWKKKRLYYILEETNQVYRSKEIYLQRIK